jgi:choice-of-anchor B domain-containing protein
MPRQATSVQPARSRRFTLAAILASSIAGGLALVASAHEDDPKVLDRIPPYRGPGWRASALRQGFQGGSLPATADFPTSNASLLAWIPLGEFDPDNTSGNSCWGYVSPSGREYALMGCSDGTGFVDVTVPSDPQIVAFVNGPDSLWHDIKVYQHHAYVVSEGGQGIQVIDMTQIDQGIVSYLGDVVLGGDTTATHTVAIDETSGFLYRCGGNSNGLRIYDLANPANPQFVATWSPIYVHECQPYTYTSGPYAGKQIVFACGGTGGGFSNTGLRIVDVTNKSNIVQLASISYPNAAYCHQGWLSDDQKYFYIDDELDENGVLKSTTYVIDVQNLSLPAYKGSFTNGNTSIGHNLYVEGNRIYEANYTSGLRIFDSTNPLAPVQIGYFDTWPENDVTSFNGMWSNYPYLPSGAVICSDIEKGMFVVWPTAPQLTFTFPGGVPEIVAPGGQSFAVQIAANGATLDAATAMLHWSHPGGSGSTQLVDQGAGSFLAELPPVPCGAYVDFYFTADTTAGVTWNSPMGSSGTLYSALSAPGETLVFADDMEAGNGSWTVGAPGDNATAGIWTRVNPVGTAAQPENDHTAAGNMCWVTGQGVVGGAAGDADVDGGKTTIRSPALNLASYADPVVRYWRWYSNNAYPAAITDVFRVDVSANGTSWVPVEVVGPLGPESGGGWFFHAFHVKSFVTPSATTYVRFVAEDAGAANWVEAAIDDFEVVDDGCPDCNGNGQADGLDLIAGTSKDFDADSVPDECQALSANLDAIALVAGGSQSLALHAGAAHANEPYLVLGGVSGTSPGIPVGSFVLPINLDAYTLYTLGAPNQPPLAGSFGTLNASGQAAASFTLPAGSSPSLSGVTVWHAYLAIQVAPAPAISMASNAMPVALQ